MFVIRILLLVWELHFSQADPDTPMITLATAHPAKFPDTVKNVIHVPPKQPKQLTDRLNSEERYMVMENSVDAVAALISEKSRVGKI